GEEKALERDRGDHQKIVTRDRRRVWPQQVCANQQHDHGAAEQTRPSLLQPEQKEFISPTMPLGLFSPGPHPTVKSFDPALDLVLQTHGTRRYPLFKRPSSRVEHTE